ncbi:MAG TPA: lytic transglycosylase F [Candidatus Sulfomarinibacteraceae bacterium]|nr:lytic transglycosylase F [Candidatus Sulfomarinibacteraceae bacterium]
MITLRLVTVAVGLLSMLSTGCGEATTTPDPGDGEPASEAVATARGADEPASEGPRQLDSFDPELWLDQAWVGDFDGMVERGVVRALVVYSLGQYFLDGATQRGVTYEALAEFEKFLNQRLGRRPVKVAVLIIPVQRDELLPALERGLGDIAAANLTITRSRLEKVDFSQPLLTGVSELVVTGPAAAPPRSLDDLAGREVCVRRSSSYWRSLEKLNEDLGSRGLQPVRLLAAEEFLQDEDLLEMVNAGLLPATVVDSHKARFWAGIFDHISVHDDLAVRTGGEIAWAFRKNSPELAGMVNDFVKQRRQGTLFGNVVLKRYLETTKWAHGALDGEDRARFEKAVGIFKTYGERYDFDHLMLAALAYQESGLDQSARSKAGAVGVMQLLPSTAADPNIGIPDITTLDNNIHAGTKYLRFIRDRYFSDPAIDPVNQTLLTFAAYNAGPARVRQLREEASRMGLDANEWFGNVEHVAAKRIGRETVQYVSNIGKYWVAYRLAARHLEKRGGG